uniref:Uncharacterized protein n=1 Tax=Glossina pallidipes TaxID=7398 RepID=A0A1A9ZQ29_GLOPL
MHSYNKSGYGSTVILPNTTISDIQFGTQHSAIETVQIVDSCEVLSHSTTVRCYRSLLPSDMTDRADVSTNDYDNMLTRGSRKVSSSLKTASTFLRACVSDILQKS